MRVGPAAGLRQCDGSQPQPRPADSTSQPATPSPPRLRSVADRPAAGGARGPVPHGERRQSPSPRPVPGP